jgi:pyruvate dehydrogenase E1 component beta subunit
VHQALRAAEHLAQDGIEADVLNLRTLRPLDVEGILASVRKTHHAVIVEDDWKFGGFGGEIAAIIQEQAFDDLDGPVLRCSGHDIPMPYAGALEQAALPRKRHRGDGGGYSYDLGRDAQMGADTPKSLLREAGG